MPDTRIPTQKRSIEKRNRIIEKGFELMCEKGFYNTNTNEIADYAGVSTGIIYQYFNDKKDIFIEGVKKYSNNTTYPIFHILDQIKIDSNHLDLLFKEVIDSYIKTNTISKRAHKELVAMEHLDDDVAEIFKKAEIDATNKIVEVLENNHIKISYAKEKVHLVMGIIDNLCHEIVYHKHEELDYDIMKKEVIQIILNILK